MSHRFIKGCSTTLNLIELLTILSLIYTKETLLMYFILIFVKHLIKYTLQNFFYIVKSLGIDSIVYKWIESRLSGRKQRVTIKGAFSTWL